MSQIKEAIEKVKKLPICAEYQYLVEEVVALLRADQATAGSAQMGEPKAGEIKEAINETINKIQGALGDPKAPWYGSDLVPWVADLVEDYNRQAFELKEQKKAADGKNQN